MRINKLLNEILSTRRPTKNTQFCYDWMMGLIDKQVIKGRAANISYMLTNDQHKNITILVPTPEGDNPTTCFTSHTDTVDNKLGTNKLVAWTAKDSSTMIGVEGGGVLGADDGAGIYIMLRMIDAGVPGRYVFFSCEEQGRVGSEQYVMPDYITKIISFDRKGTDNLITHQMGEAGCSNEFANAFIRSFGLPFIKDPTGCFTDSYSFFHTHSECINLSVGYYHQHTKDECQDVTFLEKMVDACIAMDWESLPAVRDPEQSRFDYDNEWGRWSTPHKGKPAIYSDQDRMTDFVMDYPDLVVDLLTEYGVTSRDLDDLLLQSGYDR